MGGTRPTRPRPALRAPATASAAFTTRLQVASAAPAAAVVAKVQATAVGAAAPTVSQNDFIIPENFKDNSNQNENYLSLNAKLT